MRSILVALQWVWSAAARLYEVFRIRIKHGGDYYQVVSDDDGIAVHKNHRLYKSMNMAWTDMRKLVLQQRDAFAYEIVYVGLADADGKHIAIGELDAGFREFCAAADARFPGFAAAVEVFSQNALGHWSDVEPLRLDLDLGRQVTVPQEWVDRVPQRRRFVL